MEPKTHWDRVYQEKSERQFSWHQDAADPSFDLIDAARPEGGRLIDVGAGTSRLVDRLLATGRWGVAVLDISPTALDRARQRLGQAAQRVEWITADIVRAPPTGPFDVWHDRAVFHFLVDADHRRGYVRNAARALPHGGLLVIATFAPTGPSQCSGLDVCRYDAPALTRELSPWFELTGTTTQTHTTPWGKPQDFTYAVFRRTDHAI